LTTIMSALDPEVFDAVRAAIEPLVPVVVEVHPLGWKWSILRDRNGIPIGWTIDGANRNDSILLAPTRR
jgi:hypothetical protein